jgi:LysR family transcriptional regulator, glycine cleavage system transcriptional activator
MSRVPLASLQMFVVAARAQNLSRAAERLHLTVSALSHQMRALEERLDRPLLLRGPRGVRLTEAGQRLFDAVAPHFDAIEQALIAQRPRGTQCLTVSVMASVASSWLVPRLPRFVAAYPEIELSLQSGSQLVDFAREDVDCALRFGLGQWDGVQAELLFREAVTPVASPTLLRTLGRPKLEELGRYPLLGDPGERWQLWFAKHGGQAPKRYVANFSDSETVTRAAVEGVGIALGRMTMAQPLIDAGLLVQLWKKTLPADYSHWFVMPPRSAKHPGVRAFRDWLFDEVARDVATAGG